MTSKHYLLAAISVLTLALAGCGGKFLIVKSKLLEKQRADEREVTLSPKYKELLSAKGIKKVAVRAPDACTAESASDRTGVGKKQQSVMSTDCGVEMGEIERALTGAGFVVISWRDLAQKIKSESLTAIAAAEALGATVLFQINSLELVESRPGSDARWDRVFCKADREAQVEGPKEVDGDTRKELVEKMGSQEKALMSGKVSLAAMLDVNAVLVDGAQAIWFYRWVKPELYEQEDVVAVFF